MPPSSVEPVEFWSGKHRTYRGTEWIREPTYFGQDVIERFPANARVLDAGCGQGQDSVFFAAAGHTVTALDFSKYALDQFPPVPAAASVTKIAASLTDTPDLFDDASFDVVYAHLSLHYFDDDTTRSILRDLHRVLRPGGLLCVMVNSVDDPERGEGIRLGPDYYELAPGDRKRYFSRATLYEMSCDLFVPYLLEQHGRTRKDPHRAFVRLVAERRGEAARD